jgi:hypothetical protein
MKTLPVVWTCHQVAGGSIHSFSLKLELVVSTRLLNTSQEAQQSKSYPQDALGTSCMQDMVYGYL